MSDDMASCQWCGGDGYFEWELKDGKCETCIVQDCRHTNLDATYSGSNHARARFEQVCIDCEVFREVLFYWDGRPTRFTPWNHDDVNKEDIV